MTAYDGFSNDLIQMFGTLPPDTRFFLIIILVLAVWFHLRYTAHTASLGPTLLTTLGIFATFFGVARGLSQFDTTNVEASIPSLLSGLKTAFWASVFGVGAALTLKFRELLSGASEENATLPTDDASATDLLAELRDIRQALSGSGEGSLVSQLKLARQETHERLLPLKDIQRGLMGSEDGSLITQIRLLRQDLNDRMDALVKAQTEALEHLAQMGTETLIEALRDVIKDFNKHITDQFGENFKELNTAVGRLLTWQDNYKSTIELTQNSLEETIRLIGRASGDFSTMVDHSHTFSKVAEDLGVLLKAAADGEERLTVLASGLASLLSAASGSLPEVEKKVLDLAAQMTSAVAENQKLVRTALIESSTVMREGVESVNKSMVALSSEFTKSMAAEQKTIGKTLSDNSTAIQNTVDSIKSGITTANNEFNRHVGEMVQKTKEQVVALDKALSEELTKSLEGLGRQLTALSERFVEDYGPLTVKLKALVDAKHIV